MANPIDTTFAFVKETVVGTFPATPALKRLLYASGDLSVNTQVVTSDVLRNNRASAGSRKVFAEYGADFKTVLCRDTTQDTLWESGLSGTAAAGVIKGGNTDISLSVEKYMKEAATNMYWRQTGMYVSKIGVSVDANGFAEVNYSLVGMTRATGSAILTGAVTTDAVTGPQYTGVDTGTITVGGLTAFYTSAELSIEQNRKALPGMGTINAVGMGTNSNRVIKLSCKAYRRDLNPETTFANDTPIPATLVFGSGTGNMKTIQLPACVASIAQDEVSGESALFSFDLYAQHDPVTGTDIIVTNS
jgi:hypothetical protein